MKTLTPLVIVLSLTGLAACDDDGPMEEEEMAADAATDRMVVATAASSVSGLGYVGDAVFEATEADVTLIAEIDVPQNSTPSLRITTGADCDNEGAVWDLGDVGNLSVMNNPAEHVGVGSLTATRSDWTLGDEAESDIVGKLLVVFEEADGAGDIVACGSIVAD